MIKNERYRRIFEAMTVGHVSEEFKFDWPTGHLWSEICGKVGLSKDEYDAWFGKAREVHAISIWKPTRFPSPRPISYFTGSTHAPQGFVYVKE